VQSRFESESPSAQPSSSPPSEEIRDFAATVVARRFVRVDATGQPIPFYPLPSQAVTQPHWVEGGAPASVDQRSQGRSDPAPP